MTRFRKNWPEYLIEAFSLGAFMVSACFFAVLLEYPGSLVHQLIPPALVRRALMGLAMGLTAITIIYSRWGKRSGAHFNPAVTLTFWRLKKIAGEDALFYVAAQFMGAVAGTLLAASILRDTVMHPAVHYVATQPGEHGRGAAFAAEGVIAFIQMSAVLAISNRPRIARYTGLIAGALVAAYITIEAPLSGMSLNPARTFGSAVVADSWNGLWIYFAAPPLGMLLAAELHVLRQGISSVLCAKLNHDGHTDCIFKCNFPGCGSSAGSSPGLSTQTTSETLSATLNQQTIS